MAETSTLSQADQSTINASTEVNVDSSIADRLADLNLGADETLTKSDQDDKPVTSPLTTAEPASPAEEQLSPEKPSKSAELTQSILAGEVSDNSECSVEVEEEEASRRSGDESDLNASDEEMFIEEDQDDDVEEEEEFHEVEEEEKHKTSQESVGGDKSVSPTKSKSPPTESSSSLVNACSEPTVNKGDENGQENLGGDKSVSPTELEPSTIESCSLIVNTSSSPIVDQSDEKNEQHVNGEKVEEDSGAGKLGENVGDAKAEEIVGDAKVEENVGDAKVEETVGDAKVEENVGDAKVEDSVAEKGKHDGEGSSDLEPPKNSDWADIMSNAEHDNGEQTIEGATKADVSKSDQAVGEESKEKTEDGEKKELDLDEDVKNPQYIPKKGIFYEHDDRSHDADSKKQASTSAKNGEESTTEVKEPTKKSNPQERPNENRRSNRKQRTEADRWNHDLFRDEKQKPKSKSELIDAYGFDIRNRTRVSDKQDRSTRQTRENRAPRQGQSSNQSRERRPRRQNNRNRVEPAVAGPKRDVQNTKPIKIDPKDSRQEPHDSKQNFQALQSATPISRREHHDGPRDRINRTDNRGRRTNSSDRPVDDKLPPINTVMPPITTWSNKIEDMVKEDAGRRKDTSDGYKGRSNDYGPQNNHNKSLYSDRSRNADDNKYQPQQIHKGAQYLNRNHYGDRANQHHQDWRRSNQYTYPHANHTKSNEYEPIKTQTFENSRLSHSGLRTNFRDAREIINERRLQQQNFQHKVQPIPSGSDQRQRQNPLPHQQQLLHHHQHLYPQQQALQLQGPQHQNPQHQGPQHQAPQHQAPQHQATQHQAPQHQAPQHQAPQNQAPQHLRQPQLVPQHLRQQQHQASPQQAQNQIQPQKSPQQAPQGARQPQHQQQPQPSQQQNSSPGQQLQQTHPRQNLVMNNLTDGVQETNRSTTAISSSSDLINSRPIIKTDTYTGPAVAAHTHSQSQVPQHSNNHRTLGGPMSQPGLGSAGTHLVPSHLNASGAQAQYYAASNNSRESAAAAAALATAYHGYMPGGHSVMDSARYHMTSQQLSDHGYMPSPGQTNDLAAAPVLHQQGIYTDAASAGGTVASSAYMAQAGSTLTPSNNIPVTGAGPPPMAPVSYLQHSQYAPPPYSNPYTQPQHNQAPPQSGHGYTPYWTYI